METNYEAAWAEARRRADLTGFDHGLQDLGPHGGWTVFCLPRKRNRSGHELTCEVVCPLARLPREGHGA